MKWNCSSLVFGEYSWNEIMLLLSSARVAFRLASKPCTGNSLLFLSVCSSVLLHIYYSVLVSICYHFSRICNIPRRIRFYFVKAQNEKAPPSHLALPRLPLFSLPKCWCLKPTKLMCGHTRNRAHRSEKIFWQHFNCMMLIENVGWCHFHTDFIHQPKTCAIVYWWNLFGCLSI